MSDGWRTQSGFIWSLIGSAVGFANILSFSAKAYKNGGGAYLIPYFIALLVVGIPFLILEGKIGNRWGAPIVTAYGIVWGRVGKILGWLAVISCLTIGSFYIVLTGYTAAYVFFSATGSMPVDSTSFFVKDFLHLSGGVLETGTLSIPAFLGTALVGAVVWFVLKKGIRHGIERICSLFMPLLALLMLLFAIIAMSLPGGMQGLVYYLKPNFSKLSDFALWRDVFGQLFFSLSLGLGIVVGYSRHTKQNINISRAMFYTAIGDFFVSFLAGSAIFGCLAHISYTQGIPFQEILKSDSTFEIGFILFPKILTVFGPYLSKILGSIFFFSLFIAGITGIFSIAESIAGNLEVELKLARERSIFIALSSILALSIFFCMGNGSHLIDSLAPMVIGTNMLIGGLSLVYAFAYRLDFFTLNPNFFTWCLKGIAPLILGVILIGNLWQEITHFDLMCQIRWYWMLGALLCAATLGLKKLGKKPAVL